MDPSTLCGDNSFGPGVKSADCRGGFDFTVTFEEAILAILPTACFIIITPFRTLHLFRGRLRVRKNALHLLKLGAIIAFIALQVAILVLTTAKPESRNRISLASAVLSVLEALILAALSHFEHARSVRPSFIINIYLIATAMFDAARVRTHWLKSEGDGHALAAVMTASLASAWDRCNQSKKHALARACVWALRWEILVIYVPKLCYAALNISQVYLIQNAVTYVQGAEPINKGIAETFWQLLIEVVPSVLQLAIAVYLLYDQFGAVCVAPVLITVICTGLSVLSAKAITSRQRAWLEAVQKRINYTSEILGSMKSVKILGLTGQQTANIQQFRKTEIAASKKYRKVQSLNISLVNLPATFNSFVIFAAYAILAQLQGQSGLSVSQAITSLAALNLLSAPLGTLLYSIPQGWAALGCFTRIQEFLILPSRTEKRGLPSSIGTNAGEAEGQGWTELQPIRGPAVDVISISPGCFGWSDSDSQVVEVKAPLHIRPGLTILVGPVGCGKSTLLKGLLGETPRSSCQISMPSSEIAYGDQSAWIMNGSILDNITAGVGSEFDAEWYKTVCHACALDIDFRQMPDGDSTVVGSKGVKMSGGQRQRISLARALYSRAKLFIFDDVLAGLDSVTEDLVFKRVFGREGLLRGLGATVVVLATHSVKHLPQADLILVLEQDGTLVQQGSFSELNATGRYVQDMKLRLGEETSSHDEDGAETQEASESRRAHVPPTMAVADESRKTGDWMIYKYYARALGPLGLVLFVGLVAGESVFRAMSNVWLNWWANNNENGGAPNLGYWLGIFGFMNFMSGLLMVGAVAFLWIVMIPRSGKNLHQSILDAVMRAPLSFFSETETGVLVNRFSQDLRYADMSLPGSLINIAFQLGSCLVTMALSATAVGYFAAILPVVVAALYFIQNFYLRTSRQLRLLELEANAPVFTHFIESLSGLITHPLLFLDRHVHIQRWLVLVLDLVVAGLAVIIVGMAVGLRSRINPGFLGLALVNMMSLSHALTNLVQYWTNLETSLGAIARIKDFAENTPIEGIPGKSSGHLDAAWPKSGALSFEGVSASYGNMSPVLDDITFSVQGGQKFGIVGRTGSGKSSTALAILGLINIVSGRIMLDGVDMATVPGPTIRERLVCLTQDPFLFPGSVRSNLDPLGAFPDEIIASALRRVGLWDALLNKTSRASTDVSVILDTMVDTDTFSHGQRQLFCLARAVLKPGKLLILDEPTSSVDAETDAKMQRLIRSEFQDYTIIMIAHRLSSLVDFDRVAVLDGGKLVEFGSPAELLRKGSGHFARLCGKYMRSSRQ
ncbi:hypothetical protein INS49_007378 [Diaporthe citri]|uniref:uncharacterized protein n=1 Tax=Diaporthe citri TaxID=83186 RepID=UPI001C7EAA4D|nr:uncharacterized protein INS49_007378 [Diaporthe citri]KAG6365767.1 hypothetical protein INS49_007378 [Diaporthe citri]